LSRLDKINNKMTAIPPTDLSNAEQHLMTELSAAVGNGTAVNAGNRVSDIGVITRRITELD